VNQGAVIDQRCPSATTNSTATKLAIPTHGHRIHGPFACCNLRRINIAVATSRESHRLRNIFVSASETRIIRQNDSISPVTFGYWFNFFSSVETRSRNSFMTL
jgi:hypothetical protein